MLSNDSYLLFNIDFIRAFVDILGSIYFGIGRKNPKLVLNGYDYSKEKCYGESTSWICPFYFKTRCKGRLTTKRNVVYVGNDHNHKPREIPIVNMSSKKVKIVRKGAR